MIDLVTVLIVNCVVVAIAVIVHYEILYQLTVLQPRLKIRHRTKIVVSVFGAMLAHTIEVWVFAFAYFFMHRAAGWGHLSGNYDGSLLDSGYFSFTTFTTLGFGDIQPLGDIRYLTGIESLTGLVLITWTASFLYLEMRKNWDTE
jgi:hypothetical protein